MESVVDKLTKEQKEILQQFKDILKDVLNASHTDELLVKFLRARNFNIKAARKVFLDNYYNRITFGINTLLDTYEKPEVAQKYETLGVLGYAKNGSLIRYTAGGRLDFYGFIMSMSCCDLCLYFSYVMESDLKALKEENLRTGRNMTEITYVIDLEGFTIQQVLHKNVIEMGLDFTRLIQDVYPEAWCNILVVNAPTIFDKAFNLFKPVIRSTVVEKLSVANKDSTKDLLLKYIDEDVLPVFLGGKRVDSNGDPQCKEFITFGGKIPEKLYSQNCRILLTPSDPEVKCVTLGPRCVYNIVHVIKEPGSKLRFQGRTENGSIYVSAFYKEFGPLPEDDELFGEYENFDENADGFKYKQITVEIRAQMQSTQEDATTVRPWAGIYILRLSNASNWFTSRKLLVKCTSFPP